MLLRRQSGGWSDVSLVLGKEIFYCCDSPLDKITLSKGTMIPEKELRRYFTGWGIGEIAIVWV